MPVPDHYHLTTFNFSGEQLTAFIPDEAFIRSAYDKACVSGEKPMFPFWARLWPAAIALCKFAMLHPDIFMYKKVLELGAGLALPSLLVCRWADAVVASDISTEAVQCMQYSIAHNHFKNVTAQVIDWSEYDHTITPDIVLLSDVNYAATDIEAVQRMITAFLSSGAVVILATPERIIARRLIDALERYIQQRNFIDVEGNMIHVMVMKG